MQLVNSSNLDESQRAHGKSGLLSVLMLRIGKQHKRQNASCWSRGAGLSKKKNGGCCFYFPHFLTVCKPRTCTYHSSQVEVNPLCSFLPVWSTVQINYLFIMSYSGPRCIWVHAFSNTSCFSYVLLSQLFFCWSFCAHRWNCVPQIEEVLKKTISSPSIKQEKWIPWKPESS